MRIVGLLSFYNEPPDLVAASVASLKGVCDHLIAVDGAYALYPNGTGRSPHDQGDAIRETAREIEIGLTLHEPARPWAGNEVAKRAYMFKLGATLTTRRDWYLAIDGDEIVTDVPLDLHDYLATTDMNAGEVHLWNSAQGYTVDQPIRQFFRAVRGLTVVGNHWTYRSPRHFLWGDRREGDLEPAFDSGVRVEHRWQARDAARLEARTAYYTERERLGVEGLAG